MITFTTGNIFDSEAEALVNTVNTVGVMGKGIALQFKKSFPTNFKKYKDACDTNSFNVGDLLVVKDQNLNTGEKLIINFPTKKHWRNPSQYDYISMGLEQLVQVIYQYQIKSIAIPPLGSGNGGLQWHKVKKLLKDKLSPLQDVNITIYEPNNQVKEQLKKERVKLTPARAMLLYMSFELVKSGEFVSEFSSEKLCYFLQRFGAEDYFKLNYKPNFYGPYSGKVRHVLYYLNGSYVMGFASKDKKPFEQLDLIVDAKRDVDAYISEHSELKDIVGKTSEFLDGFYSSFGLELLSTVDYISNHHKSKDIDEIQQKLNSWSGRKKTLFSDQKYIDISIKHLESFNLLYEETEVEH